MPIGYILNDSTLDSRVMGERLTSESDNLNFEWCTQVALSSVVLVGMISGGSRRQGDLNSTGLGGFAFFEKVK